MKPLHIFKPGNHVTMGGASIAFGESDLAATVRAYDPALHEAPLVIGHPKHDAPAAGWVKSLSTAPDGLIAVPHEVDVAFADLVAQKKFKKISASFYHPDAANNPVPGVYYLRHVGFLGAQPPSVKGLRPIELAEDEDGVVEFADFGHETSATLFRRLRDWLIGERGQEVADQVIPDWQINSLAEASRDDDPRPAFTEPTPKRDSPTEEDTVNATEQAALEAENKRLKQQVQQYQEQTRQAKQEATHKANLAFAEGLVGEGRLLPKHAPALVATLDLADSGEQALEFGEGDARQPIATGLKAIFFDLPKQIEFAEQASKERISDDGAPVDLEFAEKNTDPDRLNLHTRAAALATQKNISYESAVRQLIK